jgi:hypothetical protein
MGNKLRFEFVVVFLPIEGDVTPCPFLVHQCTGAWTLIVDVDDLRLSRTAFHACMRL